MIMAVRSRLKMFENLPDARDPEELKLPIKPKTKPKPLVKPKISVSGATASKSNETKSPDAKNNTGPVQKDKQFPKVHEKTLEKSQNATALENNNTYINSAEPSCVETEEPTRSGVVQHTAKAAPEVLDLYDDNVLLTESKDGQVPIDDEKTIISCDGVSYVERLLPPAVMLGHAPARPHRPANVKLADSFVLKRVQESENVSGGSAHSSRPLPALPPRDSSGSIDKIRPTSTSHSSQGEDLGEIYEPYDPMAIKAKCEEERDSYLNAGDIMEADEIYEDVASPPKREVSQDRLSDGSIFEEYASSTASEDKLSAKSTERDFFERGVVIRNSLVSKMAQARKHVQALKKSMSGILQAPAPQQGLSAKEIEQRRKRAEKALAKLKAKLKKQFWLDDIPTGSYPLATVHEPCKLAKLGLHVQPGESVEVLRKNGNPPGDLWLCRLSTETEQKYGYIESQKLLLTNRLSTVDDSTEDSEASDDEEYDDVS